MYKLILPFAVVCLFSCGQQSVSKNNVANLDKLAQQYVRLGLTIGQYDEAFVDAYYGPDSLKPTTGKDAVFPKDSLLTAVDTLSKALNAFSTNDSLAKRARWIQAQLKAFERRIKIFAGETASFDEESKDLYGVEAPKYDSLHFQQIVNRLDSLLPGKGSINDRFQQLANRFIIPKISWILFLKQPLPNAGSVLYNIILYLRMKIFLWSMLPINRGAVTTGTREIIAV